MSNEVKDQLKLLFYLLTQRLDIYQQHTMPRLALNVSRAFANIHLSQCSKF
jgi:hypothetical protein